MTQTLEAILQLGKAELESARHAKTDRLDEETRKREYEREMIRRNALELIPSVLHPFTKVDLNSSPNMMEIEIPGAATVQREISLDYANGAFYISSVKQWEIARWEVCEGEICITPATPDIEIAQSLAALLALAIELGDGRQQALEELERKSSAESTAPASAALRCPILACGECVQGRCAWWNSGREACAMGVIASNVQPQTP